MADNHTPNPVGRPSVMTTEILERLRQAFAIGCTDEEACAYAKIGVSTLYDYQRANPKFSEEKEELKKTPILKAKSVVVKSLDDVKNAQWYLERKLKEEFSLRTETTGKDGGPIKSEVENTIDIPIEERLTSVLQRISELSKGTNEQGTGISETSTGSGEAHG